MLELLIAPWIALSAPAESAPVPVPSNDEELVDLSEAARLFDAGLARYEAADYEAAIEIFTQALTELRGQGVDDFQIRGLLLYNIGRAHMRAFEIDRDVEHLRQAQAIFARFVEQAKVGTNADQVDPADVTEAEHQLELIAERVAEHEGTGSGDDTGHDTGDDTTGDQGTGDATLPDRIDIERSERAHRLGIGLSVTGVALLGGGVGMLVWGTGYEPAARAQVDDLTNGLPPGHPAFAEGDDFITRERSKGTVWMASGGVAAGLGVVALAVGVQRLIHAKKLRGAELTAFGRFDRERVFVGVSGRF